MCYARLPQHDDAARPQMSWHMLCKATNSSTTHIPRTEIHHGRQNHSYCYFRRSHSGATRHRPAQACRLYRQRDRRDGARRKRTNESTRRCGRKTSRSTNAAAIARVLANRERAERPGDRSIDLSPLARTNVSLEPRRSPPHRAAPRRLGPRSPRSLVCAERREPTM